MMFPIKQNGGSHLTAYIWGVGYPQFRLEIPPPHFSPEHMIVDLYTVSDTSFHFCLLSLLGAIRLQNLVVKFLFFFLPKLVLK